MLYGKLIDQLAARLKLDDPSNPTKRANLGDKINESYKEVAMAFPWQFLRRVAELVTTPNYTTGTAAFVNGSRTVTGSGTAWDSTMKGSFFQSNTNWYRIINVPDAQTLILESPYIDSTGNGAYKIWKRFYYLRSDVLKPLRFGKWLEKGYLDDVSNLKFETSQNDISSVGVPFSESIFGSDPFAPTYSTGSVALTQDSPTVTGSGTSWLSNAGSGDIMIVSSIEYRIKRVESDTSIILYQAATSPLTGQSYTILPDNQIGVEFFWSPDKQYVLPYTYLKKVFNMVNESQDRPELPEAFDQVILDGAETNSLRDLNDQKWPNKFQEYTARLEDRKVKLGRLSNPRFRQFAPYIPDRGSRGILGDQDNVRGVAGG